LQDKSKKIKGRHVHNEGLQEINQTIEEEKKYKRDNHIGTESTTQQVKNQIIKPNKPQYTERLITTLLIQFHNEDVFTCGFIYI